MTFSMTAFAREEQRDEQGELTWELRSVNHRFLELLVRLPEELRSLEPLVREKLSRQLSRGKVDCTLRFRPGATSDAAVRVNEHLARRLLEACVEIDGLIGASAKPSAWQMLSWPGVIQTEPQDLSPVQARAADLLDRTIGALIEVRRREGERLAEIIRRKCGEMRVLVVKARERMPEVLIELRARIRNRLQEVMDQLDETRLEQEMALLAQRLDVDEEMDRLVTHLDEVTRVLGDDGPVGRRLDFLLQELNREANTLGSKSSDVEITRVGVELKVLIEQIREQVQNIE
jgi:uncharacterized protein (TIGR00255 family)